MQFIGEDDRVREFLHWPAQPPALTSQVHVSFFFGHSVSALENALGTFNNLSSSEQAFHLLRFGHEPRVLLEQTGFRYRTTHLFCHVGEKPYLLARVLVRPLVVPIRADKPDMRRSS